MILFCVLTVQVLLVPVENRLQSAVAALEARGNVDENKKKIIHLHCENRSNVSYRFSNASSPLKSRSKCIIS